MDPERAKEIVTSAESVRVTCQSIPVLIRDVTGDTAMIEFLDTHSCNRVPVFDLVEES